MISTKKLQAIYDKAKKCDNPYISFDGFLYAAKRFQKIMKKEHGRTCCHIDVSRSGMSRKFNFDGNLNLLFNVCYNEKKSCEKVSVGGCGMDMHWHLKFITCEMIFTKKELEKYNMNSRCSNGVTL